jgi:hypothetical protein
VTSINGVRLSEIKFDGGKVSFIPSQSDRQDLSQDRSLSEIKVFNANDAMVKGFKLDYHYTGNINDFSSRLMLESVKELSNQNEASPGHRFLYGGSLPGRLSFSKDHWGYFNGKPNSTSIPSYVDVWGIYMPRADRNADELLMKASTLTQITYPTGGTSKFEYEANRVNNYTVTTPEQLGDEGVVAQMVGSAFYDVEFDLANRAPNTGITLDIQGDTYSYLQNGCIRIFIKNLTTGTQYLYGTNYNQLPTSADFNFADGHYIMQIQSDQVSCDPHEDVWIGVNFRWKVLIPQTQENKIVGGLRIAKIRTSDAANGPEMIKEYSYQKFASPLESSGMLLNFSLYQSEYRWFHPDLGSSIMLTLDRKVIIHC